MHRTTPEWVIERVRTVFGGTIGLDPCGCEGDLVNAIKTYRLPERAVELYALIEQERARRGLDGKPLPASKGILKALRKELQGILDDPETENGLKRTWRGFGGVFCNPPYGSLLSDWGKKGFGEMTGGSPGDGLVFLVPNEGGAAWFQDIYFTFSDAAVNLRGRLSFGPEFKTAAPFWSSVFYKGDPAFIRPFLQTFGPLGNVIRNIHGL